MNTNARHSRDIAEAIEWAEQIIGSKWPIAKPSYLRTLVAAAMRYRWLSDNAYGTNKSIYFETMIDGNVANIDAAIDAALAAQGETN